MVKGSSFDIVAEIVKDALHIVPQVPKLQEVCKRPLYVLRSFDEIRAMSQGI